MESILFDEVDSAQSGDDPVIAASPSSLDTCSLGGNDSSSEQTEFSCGCAEGLFASGKFSERIGDCNLDQACNTERLFVLSANRLRFHALCSRIPD